MLLCTDRWNQPSLGEFPIMPSCSTASLTASCDPSSCPNQTSEKPNLSLGCPFHKNFSCILLLVLTLNPFEPFWNLSSMLGGPLRVIKHQLHHELARQFGTFLKTIRQFWTIRWNLRLSTFRTYCGQLRDLIKAFEVRKPFVTSYKWLSFVQGTENLEMGGTLYQYLVRHLFWLRPMWGATTGHCLPQTFPKYVEQP